MKQYINLKFIVKLEKKNSNRNEEVIDALQDTHFIEDEKARISKLQVKARVIVFFDIRSIIKIKWVSEGQVVNKECFLEVLTKLCYLIATPHILLYRVK
jgi:hypothetical protein